MNALVSVDARKGELVVSSYSQTTAGFWVMNGGFERIGEDAPAAELGSAVARCLAASESGVELPPRSGLSPFQAVLDALSLSSYAQYMKGAKSVGVAATARGVSITPKKNGGSRSGFLEIDDLTEELEDSRPEQLGAAVLRALHQAQ